MYENVLESVRLDYYYFSPKNNNVLEVIWLQAHQYTINLFSVLNSESIISNLGSANDK